MNAFMNRLMQDKRRSFAQLEKIDPCAIDEEPRDLPEIPLAEAVETCHRIADKMRMDEDPAKVGAHE